VTSEASPAEGGAPEVSPFPSVAPGPQAEAAADPDPAAPPLASILDQLPVGVVAVKPDGTALVANAWARDFFQPFTVDETGHRMELDWRRISLPDGRPVAPGSLPIERCIAEDRPIPPTQYTYHADAGDRAISVDAVPVRAEDGTVLAYASTVVDQTLNRQFVEQVGEIQRELDSQVRELNRVHTLIERLSSRSELRELLAETVSVVAELDGADIIAVFLDNEGKLELEAQFGMTPEQERIIAELDSEELYTSRRAKLGLPTTLVDIHGEPGLTEAYRDALEALHAVSVYAMPLRSAEGGVLGSVASIFQSVRLPSPHQRQLLDTCGRIVAQLIVNAQVREKDRGVAEALQRSMMQENLPVVAYGEIATFYRAGSTDMYVGGDWFQANTLTDGRLSLVMGDVVGHGMEAVRMMGRMRSAVRAYTLPEADSRPPSPLQLASLLDHWCAETGAALASTACFVDIDPVARRATLASAGHPPPLLIGAGIPQFTYEAAIGAPLGLMDLAGDGAEELDFELVPGTTVLLYTDGLVERRGEDLGEGLARLAESADQEFANAGPGEQELVAACERIVAACAPESATADDVALLAFRYLG
jgi:serine phosphatase RsbU (regulator of sigma subunit)